MTTADPLVWVSDCGQVRVYDESDIPGEEPGVFAVWREGEHVDDHATLASAMADARELARTLNADQDG